MADSEKHGDEYIATNSLIRYIFKNPFLKNFFFFFVLILTLLNMQILKDSLSPSSISKCLCIPTQRLVQSADTTVRSSTQKPWQRFSSTPSQISCCSHLSCSMIHIFHHTFPFSSSTFRFYSTTVTSLLLILGELSVLKANHSISFQLFLLYPFLCSLPLHKYPPFF